MSANCINMPLRFTIMMAARTAWGGGSIARAADRCLDTDLNHLGMMQTDPKNLPRTPTNSDYHPPQL